MYWTRQTDTHTHTHTHTHTQSLWGLAAQSDCGLFTDGCKVAWHAWLITKGLQSPRQLEQSWESLPHFLMCEKGTLAPRQTIALLRAGDERPHCPLMSSARKAIMLTHRSSLSRKLDQLKVDSIPSKALIANFFKLILTFKSHFPVFPL